MPEPILDTRSLAVFDLDNPALLISGLAISTVGMGVFIYGKKMVNYRSLIAGLLLMIYPLFVTSVLWMWLIAGACLAGLYFLPAE